MVVHPLTQAGRRRATAGPQTRAGRKRGRLHRPPTRAAAPTAAPHTHTHTTQTRNQKKGKEMENRTTTRTGKKKKPFTQWPSWMTMRSARPAPPPRLAVPPRRRAPATAGQPLPPPPPTKTAPRRRAPAHGRRGNRRTGWRAARWCRGQGQNLEAGPPRGSHMPASVHT